MSGLRRRCLASVLLKACGGGGGEGYSYPWAKRTTSYLKDSLYENVYMVDKKGYDNCNATGGLVFYPAMIQ